MKAHALLALSAALVSLASCYGPGPKPPPGPRGYTLDRAPGDTRYGQDEQNPAAPTDTRYLDTATVQAPNPNAPATTPPGVMPANPTAATPPPPAPTTPPAPTPAPSSSYPTATRTKPGFVKSPFDSLGREIDVREMRSGQKARCPYTQKVFLVP
jgi:hypothetical protein